MNDVKYVDIYTEYQRLKNDGEKVSYIVAFLSSRYDVSERTVYSLIKHLGSECNLFAV